MLSEVAVMASRSYLLCLALILMSVFASARRPAVIENTEAELPAPPKGPDGGNVSENVNVEASVPLPPLSTGGGGKNKISEASQSAESRGIYDEASVPLPPLSTGGGGKNKIGEASQIDGSRGIYDEASVPLPPLSTGGGGKNKISEVPQIDGSRGTYGQASVPLPPLSTGRGGKNKINEASQTDVSRYIYDEASVPLPSPLSNNIGGKKKIVEASQTDVNRSINDKTEGRNGRLNIQPRSLAVGLIPIIPGGDGSFHFTLGPIDFGGDIGWGGFTPGYPYYQPQQQPYVVISPYMSLYPIVPPYTSFGSGHGQGQASQGYFGPYPYARGYAPGPSQTGGSASNQHN